MTDFEHALLLRVDRIIDLLERQPQATACAIADALRPPVAVRDEDASIANLLRAVHIQLDDATFTVQELQEIAAKTAGHRIRVAILNLVGKAHPGRAIGIALRRVTDRNLQGLRVACLGTERAGAIWKVQRVEDAEDCPALPPTPLR